jgi:hypothetical protein
MANMTNAEYRKARGTDKPFNGTEEQAKAIWNESIRKERWRSPKATPPAEPTSTG